MLPDLFITLTHNEDDDILNEIKVAKLTTYDPVATVCHFHAKARLVLNLIYDGLFGEVLGHFERVEF